MTEIRGVSGVPTPPQDKPEVKHHHEEHSTLKDLKDTFKKSAAAAEGLVSRGIRGTVEGFIGGVKGNPEVEANPVAKTVAGVENVGIGLVLGGMFGGPLGAVVLGTALGLATMPGGLTSAVYRGVSQACKGAKWGWNRGEYVHLKADYRATKLEAKHYFDLNSDPPYMQKKHDKVLQDTYNYFDLNKK